MRIGTVFGRLGGFGSVLEQVATVLQIVVDDKVEEGEVGQLVSGAAACHIGVLLAEFAAEVFIQLVGFSECL